MTTVIDAQTIAVEGAGTTFTTTSAFVVHGDGFASPTEKCQILRLGPVGYSPLVVKGKAVEISALDNSILVEIPGTFRLRKTVTSAAASVGYEEI